MPPRAGARSEPSSAAAQGPRREQWVRCGGLAVSGALEQALHLEHMTLLWVRMVRVNGRSPHTVWAVLTK